MRTLLAALFAFITFMSLLLFGVWFAISLMVSGFKLIAHDCGKTWGIEIFVAGELFCPTK